MKLIPLLFLVASTHGLIVEDGSNVMNFIEDKNDLLTGTFALLNPFYLQLNLIIFVGPYFLTPSEPENTCEGYCELWIEGKRIFKVNQGRNQRANAYSKVSIQKGAKIRRTSQKVLAVQGNCCWQFYQR